MAGEAYIGGSTTDPFQISHGLNQGCYLQCPNISVTGVFIRTRSDEKLFQLAILMASITTRELCIRDLLFADAAAIVAHT